MSRQVTAATLQVTQICCGDYINLAYISFSHMKNVEGLYFFQVTHLIFLSSAPILSTCVYEEFLKSTSAGSAKEDNEEKSSCRVGRKQ